MMRSGYAFIAVTAISGMVSSGTAQAQATQADAVCAGTSRAGLFCVIDGRVQHFAPGTGSLPRGRISSVVSCAGKIVIGAGADIVTFDGKSFSAPNRSGAGYSSRLSCDEKGGYWVSSGSRIAHWNGSAWKSFDAKSIAPEAKIAVVLDISAGPDGTAWVVMNEGMAARYDGTNWKLFAPGSGFDEKFAFSRVFVDRGGKAWLPTSRGMVTFKDGQWAKTGGPVSAASIAEDSKGAVWMASGTTVRAFTADRQVQETAPHSIRGLAFDSAGVLWAATEFGLARWADGKWDIRQMHNSDLPDNDLTGVAVLGKGSALPAMSEKPKGSLTVRVEWEDGKPVDDAEVQICGTSAGFIHSGGGPCANRPLFAAAKTDAEGKFTFSQVPAANYRIAFKPKGSERWITILGALERTTVGAGEAKNGGTISLQTRFRTK